MAKITNPVALSTHFGFDPNLLDKLDVLDSTLAVDTKLFIDPLLFEASQHPEMSVGAAGEFDNHFATVIKFLAATKVVEDVPWRSARRLLVFPEIRGTCLGYGANSIYGSGFGRKLTARLLQVGREIVDLGIQDPDLFMAMALFEDDIGPDRISDMATNVIGKSLAAFNSRILKELGVAGERFGPGVLEGEFLRNPFLPQRTPIILVPRDVLRRLPIALDWNGVAAAASENEILRKRVNEHIAEIWQTRAKREKWRLRAEALADQEAFQTFLDAIHQHPRTAYDASADPEGLLRWSTISHWFAETFPLHLATTPPPSLKDMDGIVSKIIRQFEQLIVNNGLNKDLYKSPGVPRHESTAQRMFFGIAYSYCRANNLDISPEVDSGNGQIDFKFSQGFNTRILVEVKLSTNPKLVSGYEKQLEAYKAAEETTRAHYLILDVGGIGRKLESVLKLQDEARIKGNPLSSVAVVDGKIKPPASKR